MIMLKNAIIINKKPLRDLFDVALCDFDKVFAHKLGFRVVVPYKNGHKLVKPNYQGSKLSLWLAPRLTAKIDDGIFQGFKLE